ncbi:MAG: TlpA family protein disulfide reductase, partial [Myxococcales bacterium]
TLHDEERARPVAVGEPAPPLTGETMTGEPFPAASLEGRVRLVSFWATWCTPCVEELPVLLELERQHAAEGVRLVAVSMDEGVEREGLVRDFFLKQMKRSAPLVLFPDPATVTAWRVFNLPTLSLLDRHGVVVESHVGLVSREALEQGLRAALAR